MGEPEDSKVTAIQAMITSALQQPDLPPLFEQLRGSDSGTARDCRTQKFYDLVIQLLDCHRAPNQTKRVLKLKAKIELFPEFERYLVLASARFEPPAHSQSLLCTEFSQLLRDWNL